MASSTGTAKFKLRFSSDYFAVNLCKILALSGILLYLVYVLFINNQSSCPTSGFFTPFQRIWKPNSHQTSASHRDYHHQSPTNISHLLFGLVGSLKAWGHRKAYIESWWRSNATRGYLFLDEFPGTDLLPWSQNSPPLRVSSNESSRIAQETRHVAPVMARMVHAILEVFRERDDGVRWYVMGDDDSIFFVDNWIDVLGRYDHTKYVYIGGHSESLLSNFYYSFDQGFGGAGFALSYALMAALAKDLQGCIRRYPYLNSADLITQYCVDELGVSLSAQRGIHQIDLRGDISGFLSSHPQSPLLSLHHFDIVDPIFPTMDRFQSTNHLMRAAKTDQSRLLQQTICYHPQNGWSFSVSWGYSVHIYEKFLPRTMLKRPLETFRPWLKARPPIYMFNTRWPYPDPCKAPHVFFFESVDNSTTSRDQIVTTYVRSSPRGLGTCASGGNHSADYVFKVQVFSPTTKLLEVERSECCDIVELGAEGIAKVKYRACMDDEIIA